MNIIRLPIIADNHGDVLLFNELKMASEYMEPMDVLENEYVAYDSEGRALNLSVVAGRVKIEALEELPSHVDDLKRMLYSCLKGRSSVDISENADLSELIDLMRSYAYD